MTTSRPDWHERPSIVLARRRSPAVDTAVHMLERIKAHRTGRSSALVAHYGFLSVFPLMLAFTTVLGFLLEGDPNLRQRILDSAWNRIPLIGQQLATSPEQLKGSVPVLVVGLLAALWAGMRAFNVLQTSLNDIAEVPRDERPTLVRIRVRSLVGILVIGGGQVAAAMLSGLIGLASVGWLSKVLLMVGTIIVNTAVLAATYHWLCSRRPGWRRLAPGAITGGVAFSVLQILGTTIVARAISHATPVYGNFASVIGLLTWISLHALIALLGAELNGTLSA